MPHKWPSYRKTGNMLFIKLFVYLNMDAKIVYKKLNLQPNLKHNNNNNIIINYIFNVTLNINSVIYDIHILLFAILDSQLLIYLLNNL